MAKEKIPFEDFLQAVGQEHEPFILELHHLLDEDYKYTIKEAKNGYMFSYIHKATNKTIANYVFRKKGPMIQMYAMHVHEYEQQLSHWPNAMKQAIEKAGVCRRMLDPDACNPRCSMGFDFMLDGTRQQKCRNNAFIFFLDEETKPYIKEMIQEEVKRFDRV